MKKIIILVVVLVLISIGLVFCFYINNRNKENKLLNQKETSNEVINDINEEVEEKVNEPIIRNKVQCTNIYRNNGKKIHYKHNSQMKTELEKYKIYEKNKIILDSNNNINTGNNINIIMNNHTNGNINNNNVNENKLNNYMNGDREGDFVEDYTPINKSTKDIINNNMNKLINRMNDENKTRRKFD